MTGCVGDTNPADHTEEATTDAAAEIERLRRKVTEQARQLRILNESAQAKNLLLDALHVVWCTGGCPGGVHRYGGGPVTEEMVVLVERQATRLRRWWNSANHRLANGTHYGERLAAKVERTDAAL